MSERQTVYIIDDDEAIRDGMEMLLSSIGLNSRSFTNGNEFLEVFNEKMMGCIVLDIRMPKMSGLELQLKLKEQNSLLPIIFITGHGDIPMAVEAMRNGAIDFIRKPFSEQNLIDRINEALKLNLKENNSICNKQKELSKIDLLSNREKEVFELVTQGAMNKMIASELEISERTVEVHRSHVMEKLGAKTLAQLVRIKILSEQ